VLFFGSGPFALPALERLASGGWLRDVDGAPAVRLDLVAVVTAPPRPAGRRREPQPTPVANRARELGILVMMPSFLRDPDVVEDLQRLDAGLIVLADYGRLVPAAVLELPRHGALNLHPSLLPRHRGAAPVAAAILAGDPATGVTLMRMDAGLDTGPIIARRSMALQGAEVASDLEARLAHLAADLLVESLPGWVGGRLVAQPQPETGATLTRPLRRSDGWLDPARPAVELERQVRAYQPWPGSWTEVDGERVIVWAAAVIDGERADDGTAGDIVPVGDALAVRTSSGLLRLDEVQPAGGKRMSGAAFRRGLRR
jgi:methionyl-tRNA formyltransferase